MKYERKWSEEKGFYYLILFIRSYGCFVPLLLAPISPWPLLPMVFFLFWPIFVGIFLKLFIWNFHTYVFLFIKSIGYHYLIQFFYVTNLDDIHKDSHFWGISFLYSFNLKSHVCRFWRLLRVFYGDFYSS